MSAAQTETPLPGRRPGSAYVRPMFEVLADFAAEGWHDAAQWPEPFTYHDLEDDA